MAVCTSALQAKSGFVTDRRRARAYKALQPILTAAMQQQSEIENQMAAFLASAPKLARPRALWQAG
jgi:hypothetical protein